MSNKIIELKGSILTLTVLKIFSDDVNVAKSALKEKVDQAPSFFVGIPVVLEPQIELNDPTFLALMVEFLHQLQMIPIGVRTRDENIVNQAQYAGLAVFPPEEKSAKKPAAEPQLAPTVTPEQVVAANSQTMPAEVAAEVAAEVVEALVAPVPQVSTAMIIHRAIRSGQQIHAANRDVIIMGSVNPGAEVLADGNITVFGKVLGKVIAGASGNTAAKIFATELNPEIVCIAGIYQLADDIEAQYKSGLVQVELKNDKLAMSKLA